MRDVSRRIDVGVRKFDGHCVGDPDVKSEVFERQIDAALSPLEVSHAGVGNERGPSDLVARTDAQCVARSRAEETAVDSCRNPAISRFDTVGVFVDQIFEETRALEVSKRR